MIKAGANQPWAASGTAALWIHWDALVQADSAVRADNENSLPR